MTLASMQIAGADPVVYANALYSVLSIDHHYYIIRHQNQLLSLFEILAYASKKGIIWLNESFALLAPVSEIIVRRFLDVNRFGQLSQC